MSKPKVERCGAEIYNRYANGGAGGMVECRKPAEAGADFCRFHKPEGSTDAGQSLQKSEG